MRDSAALASLIFLGRTLQFGGGMLLVNAAVFRWLVLPSSLVREGGPDLARFSRWLETIFLASALAVVLSGLILFLGAAAGMSGTPLPGVFNPALLSTVLFQTGFGKVCQVRGVLALLLLLSVAGSSLCRTHHSPTTRIMGLANAALATALFVSVAFTGHAAATGQAGIPWPLLADSTHLALTSVWPAGLLPFALFLSCVGEAPRERVSLVIEIARRFSAVSLLAVCGLALTGLVNAWFLVGSFDQLTGSPYGRVLCLKLFVFVLMLGIAAWNRQRLLPRLFACGAAGDAPGVAAVGRSLRHFVLAEVALAAIVIMIVSVLGVTPPPNIRP